MLHWALLGESVVNGLDFLSLLMEVGVAIGIESFDEVGTAYTLVYMLVQLMFSTSPKMTQSLVTLTKLMLRK